MNTHFMRRFALANSNAARDVVVLGNDQAIDEDGWALIAPFGEWPKTRTYREGGQVKEQEFVQVLDNESADAMMATENGLFRKLRRALVGIPVLKGHGDLNDADPKAVANETRKIKLGVVDQIRKGTRGIEAHFALDNDGAEAVAAGFKYPSGFWWVLPVGNGKEQMANGKAIRCRPFKLISVALTPYPNISGVESLANAALGNETATEPKEDMQLKEQIVGCLIAKGISLPNDVVDNQLLGVIANGDYPGHEFHGNQYSEGAGHGSEHEASRQAHIASSRAVGESSKGNHLKAAHAHMAAAKEHEKSGNDDTAEMHRQVAAYHLARANKFK